MLDERIKYVKDGVYEFTYKSKNGDEKSFKFSADSICVINCTRDYLIIKDDPKNDIKQCYINDFSERSDYLLLALSLKLNKNLFKCKDNIVFVEPSNYGNVNYWCINLNNINFMIENGSSYVRNHGFKNPIYIIKFDTIFGFESVNGYEFNIIKNKLKNYLNKVQK